LFVTPIFNHHHWAAVVFYGTVAVFVLLEQRIRWRSLRDKRGTRADRSSMLVVIAAVVIGMVAAFFAASSLPAAAIQWARWSVYIVGLVLMWAGILLRQWAIRLLGRYFTVDVRVQADQPVVANGPYRYVRHPSYSGMILTFIGMGLCLGNWLSLAVLVVLPTVGLVLRIGVEERILFDQLGEPYRRYAQGRRRLVPGLW
jgi:protein-S-isoprenylcysteine O-methyltransferase Ste14